MLYNRMIVLLYRFKNDLLLPTSEGLVEGGSRFVLATKSTTGRMLQ
jgi:hypothetical protein